MKSLRWLGVVGLAAVATVAFGPFASTEEAAGLKGEGVIKGKATFEGKAPSTSKIDMKADPVCMAHHKDSVFTQEVVLNDDKTLQNVFVYVKGGISEVTTEPAPITAPCPILTPGNTMDLQPIHTPSSMMTGFMRSGAAPTP